MAVKSQISQKNEPEWPLGYHSRVVNVGGLKIGGNEPVRVQSMTNTDTLDIAATVSQVTALRNSGCELVRVTTPGMKEVEALGEVRKKLNENQVAVPLAADIHFRPEVALAAAPTADKVRINPGNYSERSRNFSGDYDLALDETSEKIGELIALCREHHTVIRVGVNHGSLSERIMDRYGNTPMGMAESAMEFLRICRKHDFHDLVVSMKSSDVRMMIWATRLLVKKMKEEGFDCPVHLGVTEAGEGEDGMLRSAIGIGALLEDGIGDTIRVSLTGNPLEEIPFARKLVDLYGRTSPGNGYTLPSPFAYHDPGRTGWNHYRDLKFPLVVNENDRNDSDVLPDLVHDKLTGILSNHGQGGTYYITGDNPDFHIYDLTGNIQKDRKRLLGSKHKKPVILKGPGKDLRTRVQAASLLIDGLADGLWLDIPVREVFDILQASGLRVTRIQYIACPSCGRTKFDILKVLKEVKSATSHLPGLKIAVMGCIVNGPGEMADADYGYIGAGQGKVTLYKGKEPVEKNVPESQAIEQLIRLIKDSGDWADP